MTYVNNSGATSDFFQTAEGSTPNPALLPVFITVVFAFTNENLKLVVSVLQILAMFSIFVLSSTTMTVILRWNIAVWLRLSLNWGVSCLSVLRSGVHINIHKSDSFRQFCCKLGFVKRTGTPKEFIGSRTTGWIQC